MVPAILTPMTVQWSRRIGDETLRRLREDAAASRGVVSEWMAACRCFVLFLGVQRSGHSLVGSLLDAHRDATIAHELNVVRFFEAGLGFDDLCSLIRRNAEETAAAGRTQTGYDYHVEGQWQGRVDRPCLVLGDKKGGATARRLAGDADLAERFRTSITLPLRVIVVERNPYDNIATIARRKEIPLDDAVTFYANVQRCIEVASRRLGNPASLRIRHEDVVGDSASTLRRLAEFLDLDAHDDWIEACGGLLWPEPRRRRDEVEWTPGLRRRIDTLT
jgi:hypothetical protein